MSRRHILTIRGIPVADNSFVVNNEEEYTKIPERYGDDWPKKCNLLCCSCTCNIQGVPLFIPTVEFDGTINRFSTKVFCLPSCVVDGIFTLDIDHDLYIQYLRKLLFKITGKYFYELNRSEDKSIMQQFGGIITKKQYQERNADLNREYLQTVNL
jgi:hypothetical protein